MQPGQIDAETATVVEIGKKTLDHGLWQLLFPIGLCERTTSLFRQPTQSLQGG